MTKRKKASEAEIRIRKALAADPIDIATIYEEANQRGLPAKLRADCWMAILELSESDVCLKTSFYVYYLIFI